MLHAKLRLTAAKFALELASIGDLVDAAHAALDDAVYADGLAVIATTPGLQFWEAKPHFTTALRDLGHAFSSRDDALRYLRLGYIGPVAEGVVEPHDGLGEHYSNLHRGQRYGPLAELDAWLEGSAQALLDHWYVLDYLWDAQQVAAGVTDPAEADRAWQAEAVRLCRDWCREYASLYLQPAWRSETVLALASALHAGHAFDRLPILADALEEAGCDQPDLLAHCRGNSPHFEYCWVVDLLLSKL